MLADAVDVGADNKTFIHGGEFNAIEADEFPHTVPQFSVFVTLEQEENDAIGSDHEFIAKILNSEGVQLSEDMKATFRLGPSDFPSIPARVNLALTLQGIRFPAADIYAVAIAIDGASAGQLKFAVGTPPDSPQP